MPEVRLVDANVLPNYKLQTTITVGGKKTPAELRIVFWRDIEKATAIDAVPVVRCSECRHSLPCTYSEGLMHCCYTRKQTFPWGFCHMGMRRVEEDGLRSDD